MTKDEALKIALKFVEDSECGTADLEAHIKEALAQPESEYERGFIDGMQKQMQSSVDKAVNAMTQPTYYIPNKDERTWVGLTKEERHEISMANRPYCADVMAAHEEELKRRNT